MRVLHVLDHSLPYKQSGYSIRSKYLVDTQKSFGIEPIVLTRQGIALDGEKPVEEEYLDGVLYLRDPAQVFNQRVIRRLGGALGPEVHPVYLRGLDYQFKRHLERAIYTEQPDLIHVASPAQNARTAIEVGHRYGLPVIFEVRGLWHESAVAQGRLDFESEAYRHRQEMVVSAMNQADLVVTLSETMKAEIVQQGIFEDKVFIVPNGVDPERCTLQPRSKSLADRLGILPKDVVLGYIGNVRSLEGLSLLLEAGQVLWKSYTNLKILIVGGGTALSSLQAYSRELGLEEQVCFAGEVPHEDVADFYSLLDVFVIPRIRSKVTELVTSLKPYEAMAMGKALVVSDVAALCEVVADGHTGLVCKADDVEDLARKCERLIENGVFRQKLEVQAKAWVLANRTWTCVVERYKEIYEMARSKDVPSVFDQPLALRRKRIVFYSQHLIGVGHHFRNREIVRELSKAHEVFFVDGGRPISEAQLPDSVRQVHLPPLKMGPAGMVPADETCELEAVLERRRKTLHDTLARVRPDVFLIEFFPFDRWSLRPELISSIETFGRVHPEGKVVCSLRDIPARAKTAGLLKNPNVPERLIGDPLRFYSVPQGGCHHEDVASSRRYYQEVCPTLNAYFDALMVHGDPRISRLEDHFPWVEDIGIPVLYTGFVSEKLNGQQHLDHETRYVLVSAGGGAEGYAIAAPCVAAWKRLHAEGKVGDREMVIFSGLYVEDAHFEALQQMCAGGPFRLARFTSDFLQWMDGADLSVSRAGYNTCMNVLETQTRAIFVPSIAMGDQEFRAQRLADLGLAQTISPDRVTPERISEAIFEGLNQPAPEHMLALDGAEQTRKLIENL